jgi:uncharacterized protein YecE (DUF72 family)
MHAPNVLIGPAGWSYPDWHGPVYPRPLPARTNLLAWVARWVDLVEVNASFYAVPDPARVARWAEAAPTLAFLAKVHRAFTHEPWPRDAEAGAAAFRAALRPLADAGRLEALLAQLPASFADSAAARDRVLRLADLFRDVPLVLELRHRSWFSDAPLQLVERLGLSLAWIDLPPARDHPPDDAPALGPIGYVRLHGRSARWFERDVGRDARYDWLYGEDELHAIAGRIRALSASGRRTFVVTNNHPRGQAMANALELKALLTGGAVPVPETLLEAHPRLARIARPTGQQRLF